jgi:hypothetical protein
MIKPLVHKKQDQNISKPKKSLPFIPLASAIICGFSYFQTMVYMDSMSTIPFTGINYTVIHWIMMSPGLFVLIIFSVLSKVFTGIKLQLTDDQAILILHVLSSIIPAIAGWMLGTKNKSAKITATIIFILYIIISIFIGMIAGTIH